jgi:hypothetical protein
VGSSEIVASVFAYFTPRVDIEINGSQDNPGHTIVANIGPGGQRISIVALET